jgi:hypothetical protein
MKLKNDIAALKLIIRSAEFILKRFVEKVESGRAKSTETYKQAKHWLAELNDAL